MEAIERNRCAATHASDLEPLFVFRDFPVFMGCTSQAEVEDMLFDMEWVISRSSGLIQLAKLLPLEVLYPEAHGAGLVGKLWAEHHESFARFVESFNPTAVVEIGGSHGILANHCMARIDVEWTIIDPNPVPTADCKARFVKGFFDKSFLFEGRFDTVVHSHLFEHVYDPIAFIETLSDFMVDGQRMLFSIPNMQVMLERKYTNCVNFEHTIFLSEPYVSYLLSRNGFDVIRKEYFHQDHSIFYAVSRNDSVSPQALPKHLFEANRNLYLEYINHHKRMIDEFNQKIDRELGPIYVFGAHVFAQYLLAFGLSSSRIDCILDNDPAKRGKRLYGTSLKVQSPNVLRGLNQPKVILKAGVYNEEIKEDIVSNINPSCTFWE